MSSTLLILAAGMASRYGSLKQIDRFGPSGECILEYSIYDALDAGFDKIVFVIRESFGEEFKALFGPKLEGKAEVAYVYQERTAYTNGISLPAERTKPWGTAHAILCAEAMIGEPFAVINADDFYGRAAYQAAHRFLREGCNKQTYAIIGYPLLQTLSANGTVSRGICETDAAHRLRSLTERTKVSIDHGKAVYESEGQLHPIAPDALASMNFWCFDPSVFPLLQQWFNDFLRESVQDLKSEFFIPLVGDKFIKEAGGTIEVLPCDAEWFGVTYKEDAPPVREKLLQLAAQQVYPVRLWQEAITTTI